MPALAQCLAAFAAALLLFGCASQPEQPDRDGETASRADSDVAGDVQQTFRVALTHLENERYKQAAERLEPLADRQPPLPGVLLNLGMSYRQLGRYEQAESALRKAVEARPDWPAAYNELGIVLRHQGRFEAARQAYERALNEDPDYPTAHVNLGVLCDLYMGDLDCALDHYRRYQALTDEKDEDVSVWIADINRRLEGQ